VIDPAKFGGLDAFTRQTAFMVDSCHANPPRPGVAAVRMPGEQGLARKQAALEEGVRLYPTILPALAAWAERYGVAMPAPAA
jgi:LDH2 family malate/lactate/ureidoglycolate dehydrogenase